MFDTTKLREVLSSQSYEENTFLSDLGAEIAVSMEAASLSEFNILDEYLQEPAGQDMLAFLLGIPVSELDEYLLTLASEGPQIQMPESFDTTVMETTDPGLLDETVDLPEEL